MEKRRQPITDLSETWCVQCGECFKWRLIPTEEEFEEIRSTFINDPFVCSKKPEVSCDDPSDIEHDESRIWAIHKPGTPKIPKGFRRRLVMRSDYSRMDCSYYAPTGKRIRTSTDLSNFLNKHPDYAKNVSAADFSFTAPKILEDTIIPPGLGKKV